MVPTRLVANRRTEAANLCLEGFSLATEADVPRDQVGSTNDVAGSIQICLLLVLDGVLAQFQRLCAERNGSTIIGIVIGIDIVIVIVIVIVIATATALCHHRGSIEELLGLLCQGLSMEPMMIVLEQPLGFLDQRVRAILLDRNVLADWDSLFVTVVVVVVVFHWCHSKDGATFLVTNC